jgi:N6-L-threonylcarbamoyladenine synthase
MINTKDYDFSFSGLKTAILYKVKEDCGTAPLRQGFAGRQYIKQMCVEIQQAIIDVLLKKTFKAVKDFNAKTIILGGGVSANLELRRQFKLQASSSKLQVIFPPPDLSTDNGLMIAIAGYFNAIRLRQGFGGQAKKRASWQSLKADSNLRLGE